MASSPYLTPELKSYMRKFDLEQLINRTVNDLLKKVPEDPYAYITATMQQLSTPSIEIVGADASETLSGQGTFLKLKAKVRYLEKQMTVLLPQPLSILSDDNMLYDEERLGGKGLLKTAEFIQEKLAPKLAGLKCDNQEDIDRELESVLDANEGKGIYGVNSLSLMPVLVQSQILCHPAHQLVSQLAGKATPALKSMVSCLQGGKAVGSKCKVTKYYILAKQVTDPALLQNALQAVRKTIVSGKGGQAALKLAADGTFMCPLDTINDNLKIVEDAITAANAKEHMAIGLSWAADTLFNQDTKKYELENPKTPFDNDQMIDYLVKLVQDKPLIQYLQDPLATTEKAAWKKLISKLKESQATAGVKVGARNGTLLNLIAKDLKGQVADLAVPQNADSHPQSSEEQREEANSLKFKLDVVAVRAFEMRTLSGIIRARSELSKMGCELALQDCNYESYDTSLVDVCYGLGCWSCLGSIAKFDRICKLNRMREILEQSQ